MQDLSMSNILNRELSKEKLNKRPSKKEKEIVIPTDLTQINYFTYFSKNINLTTFKIPQLRNLVKRLKLPLTGTKPVLIGRVDSYFSKSIKAVIIQKTFRAYIVRKSITLRGPALKDRSLCNNDTDFISMEPLHEIPNELFFSYKDTKEFTYGFNLSSIIQSIKTLKEREKMNNPYNREKMDESIIKNAVTLYRLSFIIYPDFKNENEKYQTQSNSNIRNTYRSVTPQTNLLFTIGSYNPVLNLPYLQNENNAATYNSIREKRNLPINQRINDLFMEIDQLGNYTQSNWFTNLERNDYIRLYRAIYEIWYYRGQLAYSVRNNICPFHEPFSAIFSRPLFHSNITFDQIKLACLIVIENMVYSGVDHYHKQLGTFHALSGLTLVSAGAREAMPWLYDSVAF